MAAELRIQSGDRVYLPVVQGDITLTREKNSVSVLEFKLLSDKKNLEIIEGNLVTFTSDELEPKGSIHNLFKGFIFRLRPDKNGFISVTAYDQIRYLKNTDTYVYENKTLKELLMMICGDCQIKAGADIMDTGYVIPSRIEEQKAYLDMIVSAIDLTGQNAGKTYILWDNFGEVALHDTEFHKIPLVIGNDTAGDFDFETNIDDDTYNQIKLFREKDDGTREVFVKSNPDRINQWGLLQYSDTLTDDENGDNKAEILLKQKAWNKITLRMIDCFGDARVRGGSSVVINLDTYANMGFAYNSITYHGWMMVTKVTHRFKTGFHVMDLDLEGGFEHG